MMEHFASGAPVQEDDPICMSREGVQYGEFRHCAYQSESCSCQRFYNILLPESYGKEPGKKYPVLYLLHGIFGDENSFSSNPQNRIRELIKNMQLDGLTSEIVLVCPNMFAARDPEAKPGFNKEGTDPYDYFINDLVGDLMPHIEETYQVKTGRAYTALAGFSMGGRETLYITIKRPELFANVCAISAAPGVVPSKDSFMEHQGQLEREEVCFAEGAVIPDNLIVCCGSQDSVVGQFPKSYHELMEENHMPHTWIEVEGADHDDKAIRTGLYQILLQMKNLDL